MGQPTYWGVFRLVCCVPNTALQSCSGTDHSQMTTLEHRAASGKETVARGVSNTWLQALGRIGWAWEFLRRNPDYRTDYETADPGCLKKWGLRFFEDPSRDARSAAVFWRSDICSAVLPIMAAPLTVHAKPFDVERLQCSTRIIPSEDAEFADVLFQQDGRILQLAVSGSRTLEGVELAASIVPMPDHAAGRVLALRRFTSLVTSSALLPNLYPAERRAPRLVKILCALDLWQEQRSYRDIAVRFFGESRVKQEWSDPGDHLRDQVRRAVYYGRNLMAGGYRQFLR